MLLQTDKISQKDDIDQWNQRFEELDADGSGSLDQDDIALLEKQESERLEIHEIEISDEKTREISVSSAASYIQNMMIQATGNTNTNNNNTINTNTIDDTRVPLITSENDDFESIA